MAADRRVAYQLTISAGRSLKTLQDLTREAQASAAALAALDEAQTRAAASAAALGSTRAPRGRAPASAAPAAAGGVSTSSGGDPVAAASKEAAAQLRAEARARAAADRELERQRQAAVRQELGAIQGKAELERERIVRLRAQLEEQGRLGEKEADLVERRLRFIAEDAERQQQSLARRGVDPQAAFGATGTRQTTIGSGVLSGFFDQLLGDTGAAGAKLEGLREAAGRADTSLKTLAGALGVVSPGAEAAATAAGDLVGSLEVLLTPAGATVGAMAAVGLAFGAAGAAAVAAVLHVAEVADELERLQALGAPELLPPETAREARAAADAVAAIRPALSAIAAVIAGEVAPQLQEMATVAVAGALTISRALEATEVSALGLVESLGQAYINGLLLPLRTVVSAIERVQTLAADGLEAVGGPIAATIPRSLARAAGALGESLDTLGARAAASVGRAARGVAEGAVAGYSAGLANLTGDARADAEALVAAITRARVEDGGTGGGVRLSGGVETAVGEYGDAVEAANDALLRLREIGQEARDDVLSPWEELRVRFARAREELAGLTTAAGPAGAALAGAAERAIDAQEARAREALVAAGVEAANRQIAAQDAAARAAVEARAGRAGEAADRFGATVGQLEQGNVVGAIGAATGIPQVQVVGQALGALAQLGELGEEELRTRGEDFARAVSNGLRILPAVIIDVLPDLIAGLALAIADALLDLPAAIAQAIRDALTGKSGQNDDARAGAAGGALFGAGVGTLIAPGPGTAIGAGIGALVGLVAGRAIDRREGDASRSRAAQDLSSGVTLPRTGRGTPGREEGRAITVRGSGPGLARAIALEADAPYGRRWGVR